MTEAPGREAGARIATVRLETPPGIVYGADLARERQMALRDLLDDNSFRLVRGQGGPYDLAISLHGAPHAPPHARELLLDVTPADGSPVRVALDLTGFARLIKSYLALCESFYRARRSAGRAEIEAIDMGRRGLHNEAAELLQRRLARTVTVDLQTARRLFSLICVLQFRR